MLPGTSTGWPTAAIVARHVGMAGPEGARGALAVHAHLDVAAAHLVRLDLRHVVRHVVHQEEIPVRHLAAQDLLERLADAIGEHLAVGPGVVGGAVHGGQIGLALRRIQRRADQLPVRQLDSRSAGWPPGSSGCSRWPPGAPARGCRNGSARRPGRGAGRTRRRPRGRRSRSPRRSRRNGCPSPACPPGRCPASWPRCSPWPGRRRPSGRLPRCGPRPPCGRSLRAAPTGCRRPGSRPTRPC